MGQYEKCVMILNETLPVGLLANASAILGIAVGRARPWIVGPDVIDAAGEPHGGIVEFPVPILKASAELLRTLRQTLRQPEYLDLTVVDFSSLAQRCKTYEEFIQKMGQTPEQELVYDALALCGARKQVDRLTGSLPLLR